MRSTAEARNKVRRGREGRGSNRGVEVHNNMTTETRLLDGSVGCLVGECSMVGGPAAFVCGGVCVERGQGVGSGRM